MKPKTFKRRKRSTQQQPTAARVHAAFLKAAETVNGQHRHSLVWGFMVGLSSLALGTYHPALAQDTQDSPQLGPSRHEAQDLLIGGRHHPMLAARQDEDESARHSLKIPAGALQPALLALIEQGKVQLAYPSELVAGLQTKGLEGLYTSEEALQRLLQGTGLQYRFSDVDTVTLFAHEDAGEAGAGAFSKSDIPVIEVQPVEVTDTITRSKVFLPPVDGYKADKATGSTRTALPITETPSSIGVVTRDVIRDTFSLRQTEAFEHVSGVTRANRSGGRTEAFNLRGFRIGGRNEFSSLRSNGLPTDSIFAPDPALIERYEIIKGPASISGGASSPGGFVNRITKMPQATNFAISQFQAGSFGLYRGVVDANGVLPPAPNIRGRVLFAVEEGGNFVDNVPVRQYTVAPSIEIGLFDGAGTLLLTGHYQKFDGASFVGFPLFANGEPPDIPRTRNFGSRGENGAKMMFEGQNYEAHYNHEFVNNLTLSMKGKYSNSELFEKRLYGYTFGSALAPDGTSNIYSALRELEFETYAGEIFLNKEFDGFGQQHEVLLGVDHREQRQDAINGYVSLGVDNIFNPANNFQAPSDSVLKAAPFFNGINDLKQTGLFGQVVVRPFDRLTLVGAGRHDWANGKFENFVTGMTLKESYSEFTGRLGAIYELAAGVNVYAGYAQSFQVNAFGATRNGSLLPPEMGENYEVGVKWDLLNGRLLVTTALYRSYRQNVATTDPTDTRFSIAVGEQRHQGVELDVNGELWPGLNVTANVSYLDAEITKDNRAGVKGSIPLQNPRSYAGRVFATYELQTGSLRGVGFGGGVYFQSGFELEVPNDMSTEAYERVDAVVFYRPPQKAYEFTINVRNLLDATYIESPGTRVGFNTFGSPVSVFGTLRVKFDPDLEWTPPWVD
ncbi:MAG: ligand-gated channel [Nitrospirales bacterium]|nr:MAG: ligand-gated channel [Nitrospirales bacterium]